MGIRRTMDIEATLEDLLGHLTYRVMMGNANDVDDADREETRRFERALGDVAEALGRLITPFEVKEIIDFQSHRAARMVCGD